MFQKCISSLLIVLSFACIPIKNANASETGMWRYAPETNVEDNNAHLQASGMYGIMTAPAAVKTVAPSQSYSLAAKLSTYKSLDGNTLAEANPQAAPVPSTNVKPKSKLKHRIIVVVVVLIVLVVVSVAIGLSDRKS